MNTKSKTGFTFIEILVVVTIIALLTAAGVVSYSQFSKQSRDAKRKADLEQIRAAIELYRSSNNKYPNTGDNNAINFSTCTPGSISDVNTTYLSKIPNDPKCTTYIYNYSSLTGSTYALGAYLESGGTPCTGTCGTGATPPTCNYCVGPYGQTN